MDYNERRDKGMVYKSDKSVYEQEKIARRLTYEINTMDTSDFEGIEKKVKELFGRCAGHVRVNPPFYCDYGVNIEVGEKHSYFVGKTCMVVSHNECEHCINGLVPVVKEKTMIGLDEWIRRLHALGLNANAGEAGTLHFILTERQSRP